MEENLEITEGLVKRLNYQIEKLEEENERLKTQNRVLNTRLNNYINSSSSS